MLKICAIGLGVNPPLPLDGMSYELYDPTLHQLELRILQGALLDIRTRISGMHTCTAYFTSLPRKKTLGDIVTDTKEIVYICLNPGKIRNPQEKVQASFGASQGVSPSPQYVTVSQFVYQFGWEAVAATLIHELVHGDPQATEADAEGALIHCGMKGFYQKKIYILRHP